MRESAEPGDFSGNAANKADDVELLITLFTSV